MSVCFAWASNSMKLSLFFSCRRRHTSSTRDWSSDVCSSDLGHRDAQMFACILLVRRVGEKYAGKDLSISVPSLRIETASVELMELLKDTKRGGFTFAPEAASSEERRVGEERKPGRGRGSVKS